MTIHQLIYQLYAVVHKHGNLPVMVLNKDLGAVLLSTLSTTDLKDPTGLPRKVLLVQDEFTARKALAQSNRVLDALVNPEPLVESNIVDMNTRKRVLE